MTRFYFIVDNGYSRKKVWNTICIDDRESALSIARSMVVIYFRIPYSVLRYKWNIDRVTHALLVLDSLKNINIDICSDSDRKKINGVYAALSTIRIIWETT
jgi:hypothetical protein